MSSARAHSAHDNHGRTTAAERVAAELRRRVVCGVYRPEQYLPGERSLCAQLAAGRTTLRDALAMLAHEGLVVQAHGRGTRVLAPLDRATGQCIAVVSTDNDPLFPEAAGIMRGIRSALADRGYPHQFVGPTLDRAWIDGTSRRYGAFLFLETVMWPDEIARLEDRRVPVVVANIEEDLAVSGTAVDHRKVARQAASTLVSMGHRRIALVAREPSYLFYGRFIQGYQTALAEAGIALDESLIALCAETDPLIAYLAAKPLLARDDPPTAIITGRDVLAKGVCQAVTEAGLALGRDLSVVSYDDATWPCHQPHLTTFHEPCCELGAVAVEMLIDRLVSGWRPPERRLLEAPLIMRRTAGPAPVTEPITAGRRTR